METTKPKTWRELKAEGVKRCCGMFKNGGRCRRRAVAKHGFSWCEKHGPTMEAWEKFNIEAIEATKNER